MLSNDPRPGWTYIPIIGQYIPDEHIRVVVEVMAELSDPSFATRTHGKRSTRNAGCTGPLCKKALRDEARTIQRRIHSRQRNNKSKLQELDPLLVQFKEYALSISNQQAA